MERKKQFIFLKTKKNNESIKLKETIKKEYELETTIQEYIDNNIGILDIVKKEIPNNDIKMQKLVHDIYNKLIWKIIENKNNENKILELWNKLRPYQIEYIDEAIKKLLDNIKNHKKCIIKSPTGSGKTVMIYWIIAKLYKALGCPKQFNITLSTPFTKLCSQSITDEDNINILKVHNMNANYMQYDYKTKYITQKILSNTKNNINYINFISVCNPSMLNFINFINNENIKINLAIYDEFHYIKNWENSKNINNKCLKSANIEFMLFASATPDKTQENKSEIYGEVINKVTLKELIRLKYLCPIVPLVEINDINPKDPEEIKLEKAFGKYYNFPYMIKEGFKKFNKNKAILFCNNTANCYEMYDLLNSRKDVLGNIKVFYPYVSRSVKKKNTENNNTENNNTENNNTENNDTDSSSDIDITEEETIITPEEKKNIENVLKEYENCIEPCILITCKKISVGYSHSPIDFVIIADNKLSITDISQSIGRGVRLWYLNKQCHVLLFNSNHSSIKSFLEYFQNDVGLNIESIIREQISTKNNEYSKSIELNHKFDLTIEYDKLKFLNKVWLQVYDSLSNLNNNKNTKLLEYDILYDLIKNMKFSHKDEYKKWANTNNETEYPETYFKNNGWTNYYKFLNINIDIYPTTIKELKEKCISNNIKTKIDYENRMVELKMPSMLDELYGKNLSFNNDEISIDEIVNYLTEKELLTEITFSKIKKCILNNTLVNDKYYNHNSLIKFIQETSFVNIQKQNVSAFVAVNKIIKLIKEKKYSLELQIESKSKKILNFKISNLQ
jgi:superfamily II DNA or RNA helicase